MKTDHQDSVKRTKILEEEFNREDGGEYTNCVSRSHYHNFWNKHYPHFKVNKSAEDICGLFFTNFVIVVGKLVEKS